MSPLDPSWERFVPTPSAERPNGAQAVGFPVSFPPVSRHLIRLRFTRPAHFKFFHGGVLMGVLAKVLRRHLPDGVIPVVCEMGRVRYEPGDPYHLGLTLVGAERARLPDIAEGLHRIGVRTPGSGPLPTLGGNFEVEGVTELPTPNATELAAALADRDELTLRFVSPLRVPRPRSAEERGGTLMSGASFDLGHLLKRLFNRLFLLANGRWPDGKEREGYPAIPADCVASDLRLLRLDVPLQGTPGGDPDAPGGKTSGGFVGRVTAVGVPPAWHPALVYGQYVHVGKAAHYGLGRYLVEEATPMAADPFQPATPLLAKVADPAVLEEASRHVVAGSVAAGIDGITPEAFQIAAGRLLDGLSHSLCEGAYEPRPLLGIVGTAKPGKLRPLAIPTVTDRVAQRAAVMVLGEAVDSLLEEASFAYRKGLSRSRAAVAIQGAYQQGFRWVLDADIADFFDCVPWQALEDKLEALLPGEPLVHLLMRWVRAPVVFDGRTLERSMGLPQGAVVSPLLANLYLDELDEELLGGNFRLVRYADDFLVLCRDRDEALAAKGACEAALARLGLALREAKTSVTSFEHGFTYLGYLFCRSLVLERERGAAGEAPGPPAESWVPARSWLAQVPFRRVRELVAGGGGTPRPAVALVPLDATPAVDEPERFPLYVVDPATSLHARGGALVIEREGLPAGGAAIPFTELSHLVLVGRTRATVPLLRRLAVAGVPTYLCRASGELEAVVAASGEEWPLWRAQARLADDDGARLAFARAVVAAKLHNAATLAVRFKLEDAATVAARLRDLERSCLDQDAVESLRGLEGRGAAVFFAALGRSLPAGWHFERRARRPPPDPVNAMLSFGYTLLYHHLSTALRAVGLDPRVGLFHQEKGAYHALACDLQEELRWLADAHLWGLISRRRIAPTDFRRVGDGGACLMSTATRQMFITSFEERLLTSFTPPDARPTTYRGFMARQAGQVRDLALGRLAAYEPFRLHA